MKYTILQSDLDRCFVCGQYGTHVHEVFFGTANRKKSIRWGLVVGLCPAHHNASSKGVHMNHALDVFLKQYAQKKFEERYGHEKFMKEFHKNYLESEET